MTVCWKLQYSSDWFGDGDCKMGCINRFVFQLKFCTWLCNLWGVLNSNKLLFMLLLLHHVYSERQAPFEKEKEIKWCQSLGFE